MKDWKLTWLAGWLCAALALGLVFWWRADGGKRFGNAAEGNGPRVTKPYPRERDAREVRTKSPREEFDAARKRGLTEGEVRGIVEEFIAMNLNPDGPDQTADPEGVREEWKRRDQWYLDTLVSGFGLSKQQKKQVAERLREMREREFSGYQEYLANRKSLNEQARRNGKINRWLLMEILGPDAWFLAETRAPWVLCDLDEEQRDIIGYTGGDGQWGWISGGKMTKDFGTDERYENLDDSQTSQNGFINPAGRFFPLSMEQVDRIRGASVFYSEPDGITISGRRGPLTYVRLLTAPQLMTLLLFNPEMAGHLMKELGE